MTSFHTQTFILDGEWSIHADLCNEGRAKQWYGHIPDGAAIAAVPGVIQEIFGGYHGLAWYYKEFTPPDNPHPGGRCLLRFHEIDFAAQIWLNGIEIGNHEGLEEIYTVDITKTVQTGRANLLAVRVLSPANEPIDGMALGELPVGRRQYPEPYDHAIATGGIIGSVEMLLTPQICISDIYAIPDWETGTVSVQVSLANAGNKAARAVLTITAAPATGSQTLAVTVRELTVEPSATASAASSDVVFIPGYRLWELNDPYLYRVTARVEIAGSGSFDERSVRCGFRDFRFERGYFRFNGKRIKINGSLYTILSFPALQSIPHDEELLRRDIINIKAMGFNFLRIHCGSAIPRQLDLLDELGVLVMEENFGAGWAKETGRICADWERSVTRVIRRDRNHPSIVIWSLLNEQQDNMIFRTAAAFLPAIRKLDRTRLLMLNSGRFDKDASIGSICNPYMEEWGGNIRDEHAYPLFPHTPEIIKGMVSPTSNFQSLGIPFAPGENEPYAPVLLSEYGVCGAEDLPHFIKQYEMIGKACSDDAELYRSKYGKVLEEWKRMRLDECWARPEDYFRESHRNMAALLLDDFNCWAANPAIIGSFSSTQVVDAWFHGCGLTTPFRKMKPGMADAYADMFSPLRFCLFADPINAYGGSEIDLEAYLVNQDALRPGKYEAYFKVFSPGLACVMDERAEILVSGDEQPFSAMVFTKKLRVGGAEGAYRFIAGFCDDAEAGGGDIVFYVTGKDSMPDICGEIIFWGEDGELADWLTRNGVPWLRLADADPGRKYAILVSGSAPGTPDIGSPFDELNRRIASGSRAIYLTPETLAGEGQVKDKPQALLWAPFNDECRPSLGTTQTWYFRCDHWGKEHALFNGLPSGGILDYRRYNSILTNKVIVGLKEPFEAVAGALLLSGASSVDFNSDVLLAERRYQDGGFILNALNIRDNIGVDPVAELLLRNLIIYSQSLIEVTYD